MPQGQPRPKKKKKSRPCLKNKLNEVVHTYNPSYSGGKGRMIAVQHQPWKSARPYLKKSLKVKGLGRGSSGREFASMRP
jgi:hypothetical protein